jgi:hypothetical protein
MNDGGAISVTFLPAERSQRSAGEGTERVPVRVAALTQTLSAARGDGARCASDSDYFAPSFLGRFLVERERLRVDTTP